MIIIFIYVKNIWVIKMKYNRKNIKIDDMNLSYIDEGSGELLFFVHGYFSDITLWQFNIPFFLGKGYRVVALDLPGCGHSDKPEDKTYYPGWLRDIILEFIAKKGLENINFIGISMGALLSIKLYLQQSHLFKRLIISDCAGMVEFNESMRQELMKNRTFDYYLNQKPEEAKERAFFFFNNKGKGFDAYYENILYGKLQKNYKQFLSAQFKTFYGMLINDGYIGDQIGKIKCPCLILWGENDNAVDVGLAPIMHNNIDSSKLSIIKEAGHILCMDQPDIYNEEVYAFLNS